jgi:hypothetical protein
MDTFRDMSMMLARSILTSSELVNNEGRKLRPHVGAGDQRLAGAKMEVNLRLEAMVRGICQQVWIDQAAVAANIEDRVREALAETSIEAEIARAVASEISRMRSWIVDKVQKRIEKLIDDAIDERIGKAPATLAKKITDKMWNAFANIKTERLNGSNVYGRYSAPRTKKK